MENWYWIGEIDEKFCEQALRQIHAKTDEKTCVYLSSKGGKSDLALLLYDAMMVDRDRFSIVAGGAVASCGITLMCACERGRRFAYKNTRFMVHDLYTSVRGTLANARQEIKQYENRQEVLDAIYRAEFDFDSLVKGSCNRDDIWFDVETAERTGLINSLV